MSLLEVSGLTAGYGGHTVIHDVDLHVGEGESVALVGRNGMGKSTTLRAVMGLAEPTVGAGTRTLDGEPLGRRPYQVARAGIGYVPQGRRIFASLSVREHLEMIGAPALDGVEPWTAERVYDTFPRLRERTGHRAGTLSGGEQQMLAIARALMTNPRVVLLDEPSEGLAPQVVAQVGDIIRGLHDVGVAVLLAEQDLTMVRRVADRVCFLDRGTVAEDLPVDRLGDRDDLLDKYLGV